MAISTVDGLVAGFAGLRQKTPIAKIGLANMITSQSGSYWRNSGNPNTGAIPAAAASCNSATLGALPYIAPTSGNSTYIARLMMATTNTQSTEVHDRLAHMGGLSGVVASPTAQTVGIDINALAGTDNIAQRKGRADFSTIQWWVECYTLLGTTGSTMVINYTNHLGVAGQTNATIPANFRPGAILPITPQPGDFIRSIESVTVAGSTGTAGNFGITATVQRTEISTPVINNAILYDWAALGLPPVYDSSCLFFIGNATTTSLGSLNGAITLVQG